MQTPFLSLSRHRRIPADRAARHLRISQFFPPVNRRGASPGTFSDAARGVDSGKAFRFSEAPLHPAEGVVSRRHPGFPKDSEKQVPG